MAKIYCDQKFIRNRTLLSDGLTTFGKRTTATWLLIWVCKWTNDFCSEDRNKEHSLQQTESKTTRMRQTWIIRFKECLFLHFRLSEKQSGHLSQWRKNTFDSVGQYVYMFSMININIKNNVCQRYKRWSHFLYYDNMCNNTCHEHHMVFSHT